MASPQTPKACVEHKLPVTCKEEETIERVQRAQWLRAAILGANDGLLSTTALMLGISAAKEDKRSMVLTGLAGAVAGACSMAVGEFVSVSTQRDIEKAAISSSSSKAKPPKEGDGEITPGANSTIYKTTKQVEVNLPLSPAPAPTPPSRIPCEKLTTMPLPLPYLQNMMPALSPARSPMMKVMIQDAGAKAIEENGEEGKLPSPYKAAAASALAFLCGSFVPLLSAMAVDRNSTRIVVIVAVTSMALALFGGVGAHLGGSPVRYSAWRVLLGGWISMAITYCLLKPLDKETKGPDTD